jgi:hypothetical protein
MRAIFCLIVLAMLAIDLPARAQGAPPLFKLGATYSISTYRGAPPPFQNAPNGSTLVVKIIRYGGDQWYGVEYDILGPPAANKPDTAMIFKNRMWLNFASVLNVVRVDEPDYATLYPKGFQVVPFNADNW